MSTTRESSPWKRFFRFLKPDWMFCFIMLAGLGMLIISIVEPNEVFDGTVSPIVRLFFLAPLTLLLSCVATFAAALDRRKTEDYYFQLMANGAIVAAITTIFVHMVWLIFAKQMGTLTAESLIAILMLSWGLGYFFYRIRGLTA